MYYFEIFMVVRLGKMLFIFIEKCSFYVIWYDKSIYSNKSVKFMVLIFEKSINIFYIIILYVDLYFKLWYLILYDIVDSI